VTTPAAPNTLAQDLEPVAGELLDVAIDWLKSRKSAILASADAGITRGGAGIALALEQDLAAKGGIFTLVGPRITKAIGDAVLAAESAGETDLGLMFDAGIADLQKEAASLGG
jgi:hypothetical protein